ncbi:MAG: GNAT family N-acetyltransferase [Acidimicrobiales bacterium]
MVELRAMREADLAVVRAWLAEPHVARWFLAGSTVDREVEALRRCVSGEDPTHSAVALAGGRAVGWCQWYRCHDYPDHERGVGARPGDAGIDYAIGDPTLVGRGLGTALVAAAVAAARGDLGPVGVVADPEAANVASCRVLEKNGFRLLGVRTVASEPLAAPMAVYRLAPARPPAGGAG